MAGFDEFDDPLAGNDLPGLELAMPEKPKPQQSVRPKKKERPTLEQTINAWEVQKLGDFGEAPSSIIGSAPYALTALFRLRDLAADKRALEARRTALHAAADRALVPLGQKLSAARAQLERYPELAEPIEKIEHAESRARVKAKQVELANAGSFHEREELIRKVALLRGRLGPVEARAEKHQPELDVLLAELVRRDTRVAEAEAELRTGPEERRFELETALVGAQAEQSHQRDLVEAKRAEMVPAMAELDELRATLKKHEKQLTKLEKDMAGPLAELAQIQKASEAELTELVARLADVALDEAIEPRNLPEVATAKRAREERHRLLRDIKLHELALRGYDQRAFRNGAIVVGTGVFVLLVVFGFWVFR